jgi:hypothetical protein
MAARYKAIADAFARVVVSTSYRDKWITDHDFVRIIACEYDLAIDDTIKFDVVMLNRALKNDTRYSLAEDQDGCEAGTVFRKHYSHSKRSWLQPTKNGLLLLYRKSTSATPMREVVG